MAWALIAQSAIETGCHGIIAASDEICQHIEDDDGPEQLHIFGYLVEPGLYLWTGTMQQAFSGEGGASQPVPPDQMAAWIDKNGDTE